MPALRPPLPAMPDAGLAAGNVVTETSARPPQLERTVIVRYRFGRRCELPGSDTAPPTTRHYRYAGYTYSDGQHRQLLACEFGQGP